MLVYSHEIIKKLEINLPIVTKHSDKKLVLKDYTLDSGHFIGLSEAISQTNQPEISQMLFDNCGIDDYELSILFEGLMKLERLEIFAYMRNEFKSKSL